MVIQCKSNSELTKNEEIIVKSENMKTESAANVLQALRKRNQHSMINGMDSLTLLRSNVQSYFNERINVVMKDFMKTFFEPAIKNIKDNTSETITDQQIKFLCKSLLDTCSNQQYSTPRHEQLPSPFSSSLSRNNSDVNTSDSDNENGQTSLLHQALKRKRTESETEQLFKRQFFLTKTSSNYFGSSTGIRTQSTTLKPTTTSIAVLSSAQKIVTRPTSGILTSNGTTTSRPIIHIIPSANKNLVATHMELATLLSNSNETRRNAIISAAKPTGNSVVTSSNIVSSTTSDSTKVTSTQSSSESF